MSWISCQIAFQASVGELKQLLRYASVLLSSGSSLFSHLNTSSASEISS